MGSDSGILVALFSASALPVGVLLAQNRGRSGWIGLAFTMFLGWFGVLIVAILPREPKEPPVPSQPWPGRRRGALDPSGTEPRTFPFGVPARAEARCPGRERRDGMPLEPTETFWYDSRHLPARAGVYALVKRRGAVIRIGETADLAATIGRYRAGADPCLAVYEPEQVAFEAVGGGAASRRIRLRDLLTEYDPPCNA